MGEQTELSTGVHPLSSNGLNAGVAGGRAAEAAHASQFADSSQMCSPKENYRNSSFPIVFL